MEKLKVDAQASFKAHHVVAHPTDEQLQTLVEDCMEYVDLMQDTMPDECALVTNFQWVHSHLFGLS